MGFDPTVGLYHRPRHGRPALALDLMEEFRPLVVDSTLLSAVNTEVVRDEHFVLAAGGCALTDAGRKAFLGAYERRMDQEVTHPLFKYVVSYRRVLEVQARLLSAWCSESSTATRASGPGEAKVPGRHAHHVLRHLRHLRQTAAARSSTS